MPDFTHFTPSPSQGRSGATSPPVSRTCKWNAPVVLRSNAFHASGVSQATTPPQCHTHSGNQHACETDTIQTHAEPTNGWKQESRSPNTRNAMQTHSFGNPMFLSRSRFSSGEVNTTSDAGSGSRVRSNSPIPMGPISNCGQDNVRLCVCCVRVTGKGRRVQPHQILSQLDNWFDEMNACCRHHLKPGMAGKGQNQLKAPCLLSLEHTQQANLALLAQHLVWQLHLNMDYRHWAALAFAVGACLHVDRRTGLALTKATHSGSSGFPIPSH